MTTLQEKIDALPEWPSEEKYSTPTLLANGVQVTCSYPADEARCLADQLDAALARLALVLELAKDGNPILVDHLDHCYTDQRSTDSACTCGRDALLKALETP